MNPRVKQVQAEGDYLLRLKFENDEIRTFDMKPYLPIGVFQRLRGPRAFRAVHPSFGGVQWKDGQDLCPDTLYEGSIPLSTVKPMLVAHEKQGSYKVSKRKIS